MRIELNAGGLGGAITVAAFALSYEKMLNQAKAVAATFKTVKRMTSQANGGVGKLQTAVDSIEARLRTEEKKIEKIVTTQKKLGEFIVNTIKTDTRVAVMVAVNREMFYLVNPWARPSLINIAKRVLKIIGSTLKKAWYSIKWFYQRHKKAVIKAIVTGVVLLGLAALTIVAPEVMVPILAVTAVNTLAGVVVDGVSKAIEGGSAGEIFDAAVSGGFKGMIGGLFKGIGMVTGQPWLDLLGGPTASLIDGLIEGKSGREIFKDMVTDFAFSFAFAGFKIPKEVESISIATFTDFMKELGKSIFEGFVQKGGEVVLNKVDETIKKGFELVTSCSAVKEALNSNVIGVKPDGVWNGYQAMNVDFTHNFKEFVAQKFDIPGGFGKIDAINQGLQNATGGGKIGGWVTPESPVGPIKPQIPIPIHPPQWTPGIGGIINTIINPQPIPIPTILPPIDIRDIIRPVNINININIIFKPSSIGAVVA